MRNISPSLGELDQHSPGVLSRFAAQVLFLYLPAAFQAVADTAEDTPDSKVDMPLDKASSLVEELELAGFPCSLP